MSAEGRWARLSELQPQVEACAEADQDWSAAFEGQVIRVGGQVRTGDEACARVDLGEGAIVRLAAHSHFELLALSPAGDDLQARLKLMGGALWLGVLQAVGLEAVEVETPTGVAGVRGSFMSVGYDPRAGRMPVTCLEGHCRLTAASGRFTDLTTGQQAEIAAAGQDPGPARPMDAAQFAEWARRFPEAPTPGPTPASSGPYVLDASSCPGRPATHTAPGGRAYLVLVSEGPYPDADIAQHVSFEVWLGGQPLPALEPPHADDLGGGHYHVRQTFDAGRLAPGAYPATINLALDATVRAYDETTGQIISLGPQTWPGLSGCTWIIAEP